MLKGLAEIRHIALIPSIHDPHRTQPSRRCADRTLRLSRPQPIGHRVQPPAQRALHAAWQPPLQQPQRNCIQQKARLLGPRQHGRTEPTHVGFERARSHAHHFATNAHAYQTARVLLLRHGAEACVVATQMRAHHAQQPQLGAASARAEHERSAAHAKERVGEQHGTLGAAVVVEDCVLGGDHERKRVAGEAEHVLGQVHGDEACAAAHAPEVKGLDVLAHFEAVDHHRRERRGRAEQ